MCSKEQNCGENISLSQLSGMNKFRRTVKNSPRSSLSGVLRIASHFTLCFFENNLTPLFLFAYNDHHLKCIKVVFFLHRLHFWWNWSNRQVMCVMTQESEIKHIPIRQLIYSKYICSLSLQLHCVCCNSHCIRLLTQAAYNKTSGFLC